MIICYYRFIMLLWHMRWFKLHLCYWWVLFHEYIKRYKCYSSFISVRLIFNHLYLYCSMFVLKYLLFFSISNNLSYFLALNNIIGKNNVIIQILNSNATIFSSTGFAYIGSSNHLKLIYYIISIITMIKIVML